MNIFGRWAKIANLFYCHGCHFIRSTAILGGLHHEYSFEKVAA